MKNRLHKCFKIFNYITSNERYKAMFFVLIIISLYGSLTLGVHTGNFFDSILIPFQFNVFNIFLFSILFLSNLNIYSIFKKDFSFYIIRLKDKKTYIKTLITLSIINYIFNFIIVLLTMLIVFLLTTIHNTSVDNYLNYNINTCVYLMFYMFRYIIYGLLVMMIFTLVYVNTNKKISIGLKFLFLLMFMQCPVYYSRSNISLLIWFYFNATTFSTFSMDVLGSILVLLILEVIFLLLLKLSKKSKRMEIL